MLKSFLSCSYSLDIALETTPQLVVQLLVVLLGLTVTFPLDNVAGFEHFFNKHRTDGSLSAAFFYFSLYWSFQSVCTSLTTTHLYRYVQVYSRFRQCYPAMLSQEGRKCWRPRQGSPLPALLGR